MPKGKTKLAVEFKCDGGGIGMDVGSPVDFNYKLALKFSGKIEKVVIDLK